MHDPMTQKECVTAQVEQMRLGAKCLIVDVSKAQSVPPQETQKWFGSWVLPEMAKAGCIGIITVTGDALTKLATRQLNKSGEVHSIGMYEAASLEAARKLAQELVAVGKK